jgi:hypothetical protein
VQSLKLVIANLAASGLVSGAIQGRVIEDGKKGESGNLDNATEI